MASEPPLVCQRIREYRERRRPKTSQEKVARGLGMSLAGYRKWENDTEPSEENRRRLAEWYQSQGDEIREDYFIRFAGESEAALDSATERAVQVLQDAVDELARRLDELEGQLRNPQSPPVALPHAPSDC